MDDIVAANIFPVPVCQSLPQEVVEKHFLIPWGNTIKPACAQSFSRVETTSMSVMRAAIAATTARIGLYNLVVKSSYRYSRLRIVDGVSSSSL